MGVERLHVLRSIPSCAHNLRESLRIVLIGLVHLHLERGAGSLASRQTTLSPRQRSSCTSHGVIGPVSRPTRASSTACLLTVRSIPSSSVAHWSRHSRWPVSSTIQIDGSFFETSKPTNRATELSPMLRAAGRRVPTPGIMDDICSHRDYTMSTHGARHHCRPQRRHVSPLSRAHIHWRSNQSLQRGAINAQSRGQAATKHSRPISPVSTASPPSNYKQEVAACREGCRLVSGAAILR